MFWVFCIVFAVYFLPLRAISDKNGMSYAVAFGDDSVLRLMNGERIWVIKPGDQIASYMNYVVFKGDFTNVSPEEYVRDVDNYGIWVGMLEFDMGFDFSKKIIGMRKLNQMIFRVHTLRQEEVQTLQMDYEMIYHRFRRAILERSIDLIWIQHIEGLDQHRLLKDLKSEFGPPSDYPEPENEPGSVKYIGFAGLLLAIALFKPLLIVVPLVVAFWSWSVAVSTASIIATVLVYFAVKRKMILPIAYLFLGLVTNASLSSFEYLNQVLEFRGVKLSLIALPLSVGTVILIKEWGWIKRYVILLFLGAFAVGYIYISRSGNYGFASHFERQFRDLVESILWVRPRFKEVVGYPVFFAFLFFQKSRAKWIVLLELIGAIALVSTFNTFCHLKTPVLVSIYRSSLSIFLGYLTLIILTLVTTRRTFHD